MSFLFLTCRTDSLFPPNTAADSALTTSTPNLSNYSSFPCGGTTYSSSSPKAPRSPTTNLPTYQEALQNSICVQSPTAGSAFNNNELLNGYHEPVSQRKISSPNVEDSLLASPGSPMRVDNDDVGLLTRSVLDANGYRRDSFENFRTQNVQDNSIYHVNPSDIFGNPRETRLIKQEDTTLPFLDMETAEFAESMDFGITGDAGILSGITFSQ